jgi:GNAT superfamily N-acetyltransferase
MAITIECYTPLAGSPAEALWREGEASYVDAGRGRHAAVTAPPPDLVGWCAVLDGEMAGLQACRLKPEAGEAHGLLSWVRPAYRRRGVFAAIQAAVDRDLALQGLTAIRSWVVEGPDAAAMAAAIITRGGAKVAERSVTTASGGNVTYHEYLRPLRLA